METGTFWHIIDACFGVMVFAFGFILNNIFKKMDALEQQIEATNRETADIKSNYLDRFEKITRHVTKEKEEIIEKIHELQIKLLTHNRNEKN